MPQSLELTMLIGSVLILICLCVGKLGSKFGIPVLLMFLCVGMFYGITVNYQNVRIAEMVGTAALAIILFSGGMNTKITEIKPIISPGILLSLLGVIFTSLITGVFAYWFLGQFFPSLAISLLTGLLVGSITSSTDSASVFGTLRTKNISLKHNLRPLLEFESGSNDAMAYILTITIINIITIGVDHIRVVDIIFNLLCQILIGCISGFIMGKLTVYFVRKIRISNMDLYPIVVTAFGTLTFSLTHFLNGNGFLAVYIAGIIIGNSRFYHRQASRRFLDSLTWISQLVLFLTLGIFSDMSSMKAVLLPGIVIGIFIILVSRPVSVFLCLLPFKRFSCKDKMYISLVGLRGAVPIIFAIYAMASNVSDSTNILNFVFIITLVSLLIQGMLISPLAKKMNLSEPVKNQERLKEFEVELDDDMKSVLSEVQVTDEILKHGHNLMTIQFPEKALVVMIKRGDKYIVPNGGTELKKGDILLVIADNQKTIEDIGETLHSNETTQTQY